MTQIQANGLTKLHLGRQGENLASQILFDVSGWEADYGPGVAELIFQRNLDELPYPVAVDRDGSNIVWTVTATDTELPGENGHCELRYYVGDTLAKSQVWTTRIIPAIPTPTAETPPKTEQGWVDQVISVGAAAKASADAAKADADRSETARAGAEQAQDLAEQAAAQAGWAECHIDERGHLIYSRTDNVRVDFKLVKGRLVQVWQ